MASQFVDVNEASKRSGVSTATIYQWIKVKKGESTVRFGNKYLINMDDLNAIKKYRDNGNTQRGMRNGINLASAKLNLQAQQRSKVSADGLSLSLSDLNKRAVTLQKLIDQRIAQLEAQIQAAAPASPVTATYEVPYLPENDGGLDPDPTF